MSSVVDVVVVSQCDRGGEKRSQLSVGRNKPYSGRVRRWQILIELIICWDNVQLYSVENALRGGVLGWRVLVME